MSQCKRTWPRSCGVKTASCWEFPGGPVGRTPCFHCYRPGFNAGLPTSQAVWLEKKKQNKTRKNCLPSFCSFLLGKLNWWGIWHIRQVSICRESWLKFAAFLWKSITQGQHFCFKKEGLCITNVSKFFILISKSDLPSYSDPRPYHFPSPVSSHCLRPWIFYVLYTL